MVFKSIQNIKKALSDVLHVAMFYNNGIIFQTTFEQDINIPKLGENLSEVIEHFKKTYELCKFQPEDYQKIIFETDNVSIVIFKLGEDSNIALFFGKKDIERIKFTTIKKFLDQIEALIDMDKKEIELKKIELKEQELNLLIQELNDKQVEINKLENKKLNPNIPNEMDAIDSIDKEIKKIVETCQEMQHEINKRQTELDAQKKML